MIIKSIEIENFLSYYTSKNKFVFGDGPTIIIGQNRTGKSKLFDAINWAFYDKAYNTDFERWDTTKDWKEQLVNNNAKSICKVGDSVNTSVIISFEDETGNKYVLTKEYKIKKKSEIEWDSPRNATVNLNKKDHLSNNSTDTWDIEAEDLVKNIFPENLSKYFLFQGENISQIMSLNNKSAFTKALRDLSRIEVFERAKNYTDKVYKQLKKEFESKEDTDKQLQERKIQLSAELDKLKEDLQSEEEQFDNYVKERDTAKDVFDKKNEELKKFEECAKILADIKYLEEQKTAKIDVRTAIIDNQKKEIFESWMYAGTESIIQNFHDIYKKNKIERKIPEPIRQEFIKEMLDQKKCLVCGSEAKEGSIPHKHIKSLLNDKALDKETELINKLSFVADTTLEKVVNIKSYILDFYKKTNEIDEQIKNFSSRIKTKEEELRSVIPSDVSEDDIKKRNFAVLSRDRDNAKIDLDRFEGKINGAKSKIEYIDKQKHEKQKEYDSLVENSSNKKERERLQLAEKINDTVTDFYDNFLTRLIEDIETESNTYFSKMTEKNSALSGKVKVDYELKEVYTVDEAGNRLFNINQANKVSLQISFVGAVLSVSNKFWNTYFPFIADAPISALGGNNKVNTVETMIDIFNQSIIILKDDAVTDDPESVRNDLTRTLINKSSIIEHAYELSMVGNTLEEQHTKIEKIK
jgi:DNA sulfur modification protein DndD